MSYRDNEGVFSGWRFGTFHLICCVFLVMTITFLVSYQFYNGVFDIIFMPFSYLGDSTTVEEGNPNTLSMIIYAVGCILSGSILFLFARRIGREPDHRYSAYLRILGIVSGTGFFIMIVPDNIGYFIHDMGAILGLGGIWIIATLMIMEIKDRIPSYAIIIAHMMLHSTMLIYTISATLDFPIKNLFQKFGLVGLFIVTFWAIRSIYNMKDSPSLEQYRVQKN